MSLEDPRRRLRHPRRRQRPRVPAPRERDRAGASAPATSSRGTGSTTGCSTSTARRCRSRSATSRRSPTCSTSYDPRAFRLLVLQDALPAPDGSRRRRSSATREKDVESFDTLLRRRARRRACPTASRRRLARFRDAMDDDFDTPGRRRRTCSKLRRDANTALDDGRTDDAARAGRDRALARRRARPRALRRRGRARRRDRRRSSRNATRPAPRRTAPKPTASATSCSHAASCSRTRPNGTVWRQADGAAQAAASTAGRRSIRSTGSAASRSKAAGRCSSCCAPGRRQVRSVLRVERRRATTRARRDPRARRPARSRSSTPSAIDELARTDVPQGVIATAAPLRAADLDELLAAPDAFLVALDGVTDPRNLGAVARVAETAGATGLVAARATAARGITPVVAKAAAGAIEYLPIALVGGIPNALERARRAGCWTIGLDASADEPIALRSRARRPAARARARLGRARLSRARRARAATCSCRSRCAARSRRSTSSAAAALACHEIARRRAALRS